MAALYLGQVFDAIKLVLNKERKGSVKDSQIVTALRIGSMNYFGRQLMEYRAGAEVPSTLRVHKITAPVVITTGAGPLPVNFAKEVSFVSSDAAATTPRHGDFLTAPEYYDRLRSALLAPSLNDPIGRIEGTQLLVAPTGNVTLTYIKKPLDFVFVPTVDADGRGSTVDLAASTDIDFSQECLPDIIKESLILLGIKQQDAEATQYGAAVKE